MKQWFLRNTCVVLFCPYQCTYMCVYLVYTALYNSNFLSFRLLWSLSLKKKQSIKGRLWKFRKKTQFHPSGIFLAEMYITPIHVQDILKSLYFLSFSFFLSLLFRRNHWIAMQKQLLYRDTFMKFKMKHVFNLWCSKYEYETGGTNLRINRDSNPGPLTFQNLSCFT